MESQCAPASPSLYTDMRSRLEDPQPHSAEFTSGVVMQARALQSLAVCMNSVARPLPFLRWGA